MDIEFYIFLFIVGTLVGFFSGLLGIGGALLMFPILLYVPGLLGMKEISVHLITGITSMQTTFGTAASAYFHHKMGKVSYILVLNIGTGIAIGALIGAVVSRFLPEIALIWIYIAILSTALILMLIHKHSESEGDENINIKIARYKLFLFGFIIGVPAGAIGLAGSIVIIPLLNSLFDVPIKICISSGTHIAFIASFVSFLGKLFTGQIELISAVIVSISATIGAYWGSKINKKANPVVLKNILFVLIVLALLQLCYDMLSK